MTACGAQSGEETTAGEQETADPRDVTAWSPSFVPDSRQVTSADETASRLDQVAQVLSAQGLPAPTSEDELPDVVKSVSSYEAPTLWSQCLTREGFESTDAAGFVSTPDLVPEQSDVYFRSYADCVAQYPIDAKYRQEWGSDQWKVQYEYLVDFYIPCVESYGITIDPETVPSEQIYVESGLSQGDVWHPAHDWMSNPEFTNLADTDTPEGAELASTCRQSAPDEKLFG